MLEPKKTLVGLAGQKAWHIWSNGALDPTQRRAVEAVLEGFPLQGFYVRFFIKFSRVRGFGGCHGLIRF
jgi:hypothetical protein